MRRHSLLSFLAAGLLAATGCDAILGPEACTDIAIAGLRLAVVDEVTGAPVWTDATIVVSDGDYRESTTIETPLPAHPAVLGFAVERAGRYTVEVSHADYLPWRREDILVTQADECHVRPVDVEVELTPRP